ncbi:aminopeptidase [Pedobacter yulinensis]|uniref:Aminopeptidase n=1 Tax=Pedobacter yulinensis TaxID=2126353 RepID=A0A2T3HP71_9SPHI|nr:M1 family metallopeptidase [Pedobacter yulinensis]PST84229.1 aminopeptidase [Pedobacter yulinensis]
MKKFLTTALACFVFATGLPAQQLYMPRNVKAAFEKGTRSMDGKPGRKYWQNNAQYDMKITVDPKTRLVSGTETIRYNNNSPDTLKTLVMRFVNNLHKPEAPRAGQVSTDFLAPGLVISSFIIDGERYGVTAADWGTTGDVKLKKPLHPRSTATLEISWQYPLSKESGREGQIDERTFFVAYAYPRVSVYDDYNGWDRVPHTDRAEFYNDFNDYSFSVTVPKNYVVWATGDLLNPEEVLQPEIAARLKRSYTSDAVIHVATAEDMEQERVTQQKKNTWKFAAKNICDITFGLSDHYVWDAGSTVVDKKNNRRASTQAAYNKTAKDFTNSVAWNNYALTWFSENWPGIAYPFTKMTAFQGFADMEYPMMVNDASVNDLNFARLLQDHEVAHTYFPFFMGTNETRYAFMDEGWATTFEYLIGMSHHDKAYADEAYKNFRVKRYIFDSSAEQDQPIISMSTQVSGAGYGNNAYVKASLAYLALKDLLGDATFKKALHTYMNNWNGKHPMPWDFFNSMNAGSGQNLNWFFNNWFFSNNYIDLAVTSLRKPKSGISELTIENRGGFAIPFDVEMTFADGSKKKIHQTPAVWKAGSKRINIALPASRKIRSVRVDGGLYMDPTPANNLLNANN